MNTNATAAIRALNGKRIHIPMLGGCALLATFFLAACSSNSNNIPGSKNDGSSDLADSAIKDVIGAESVRTDVPADVPADAPADAPAGCST